MAIDDNNTTGRFLNQRFALEEVRLRGEGRSGRRRRWRSADRGVSLVIADLSPEALLKAADAGRPRGLVLFNVGAIDDRLREEDCRANVFHTAPTRSMLADGLAQYLIWKQWPRWVLIDGSHRARPALRRRAAPRGDAVRRPRSSQKRVFKDTGGARRTDCGVVQIQRQMPVFTQDLPDHDVLVVADESEVFGNYVPYRTWDAAAGGGLGRARARQLASGHEQWGGYQMQNRFVKASRRRMRRRTCRPGRRCG